MCWVVDCRITTHAHQPFGQRKYQVVKWPGLMINVWQNCHRHTTVCQCFQNTFIYPLCVCLQTSIKRERQRERLISFTPLFLLVFVARDHLYWVAAVGGHLLSLTLTLVNFHTAHIVLHCNQSTGSPRLSFNWPFAEVSLGETLDSQFIQRGLTLTWMKAVDRWMRNETFSMFNKKLN